MDAFAHTGKGSAPFGKQFSAKISSSTIDYSTSHFNRLYDILYKNFRVFLDNLDNQAFLLMASQLTRLVRVVIALSS